MAQCDHRPARLGLVAVAALAAALFALPTDASAYAGWLTSAEMELSVPFFMLLTWEVTENPDHTWHYLYAFEIEDREPLFFILETSGDFTYDDILSVGGDAADLLIGWHSASAPGHPFLPEDFYGIRFDFWATGPVGDMEFDSARAPTWGDFYAKDGTYQSVWITAVNAGFTAPDSDPDLPPQDDPIENHILVPGMVPAPDEPASWAAIKSMYR